MTVLFSLLVFVLSTSRARALDLVDEKTTELRRQALHDELTGLPNRWLILDRAEQLLARCRAGAARSATVLFVDLDNFKDVNDTLGHAVGDELLQGRRGAAARTPFERATPSGASAATSS